MTNRAGRRIRGSISPPAGVARAQSKANGELAKKGLALREERAYDVVTKERIGVTTFGCGLSPQAAAGEVR